MQMIEAVIKPQRLDAVKEALMNLGVHGLTVLDVRGYGRQLGHKEVYRGTEVEIAFQPKLLLKIVVNDDLKDRAVDAIVEQARSGEVGDGKIFIMPVAEAVRIRTGERDESVL